MSPGATGEILRYCRGKLFLFMPNVCDAECAFCYVAPTRVETARVPAGVLDRAMALFAGLAHKGLREVRITGGEPLVFQNLPDLVAELRARGLAWTLLTNGIRLKASLGWLIEHRPSKITVSVHSLRQAASVFGRPMPVDEIVDAITTLVRHDIPVSATIVGLPAVLGDLHDTLSGLEAAGVREYKLIHPNDSRFPVAPAEFRATARRARQALSPASRLRVSDTTATGCLLRRQGELSVTLPRFEWSWCCATVGTDSLGVARTVHDFEQVARSLSDRIGAIAGLPCHHQGFCPIALAEPEK